MSDKNSQTVSQAILFLGFFAAGTYLICSGHPVAGGFCIFGAICVAG